MKLLETFRMGDLTLKNRVVVPPMTRSRANMPGHIPSEMMVKYYADRADAGLIISEGVPISELGRGYAFTPGIYTKEQIEAWKKITSAVHDKGGVIFAQLWHVGRVSHSLVNGGQTPVSASDELVEGLTCFVPTGDKIGEKRQVEKPKALSKSEIKEIVEEFKNAAKNALEAGFDGVELHAANGYLVNQFIDSLSNHRTDEYGGSVENRLRFLKEVVEGLVSVFPKNRVGVRIAPLTSLNKTVDEYPEVTYTEVAKLLSTIGVAYIHIAEADWEDAPLMSIDFKKKIREVFSNTLIYAGKYTVQKAEDALEAGLSDLIAFGRPFISNPDLVNRIKHGYPFAPHDPNTLFGGDEKGLNDYKTY